MASVRGILNIQSLNELTYENPWSYMQDVLMDWSKENEYCDVKKG
jgi:hypothetical protein